MNSLPNEKTAEKILYLKILDYNSKWLERILKGLLAAREKNNSTILRKILIHLHKILDVTKIYYCNLRKLIIDRKGDYNSYAAEAIKEAGLNKSFSYNQS